MKRQDIRNGSPDRSGSSPVGRIRILHVISLALFLSYSGYLFYLQAIRGNDFRTKAEKIAMQTRTLPAQRGEILDRTGKSALVSNTDSFAVSLVPANLPADRRDSVFSLLASTIGIPEQDLRKKVPPVFYRMYQPIELVSSVPFATITRIAENLEDFPGVEWRSKPIRSYLGPGSLAHITGYVGDITRDEYKLLYNENYSSNDVIGKAGIEKQYDKILKGKAGRELKAVDVKGRNIPSESDRVEPPVQGTNLVLSIDAKIQDIAEKALGPRMGSAIVLKPATGEILAMVSYPWYDPGLFTGKNSGNEYAKLLADPNNPLMNRAIQSSYPPASTFKTVLTTALYEEKSFPAESKIVCLGELSYGERIFKCWIHRPGHGLLDLRGGLAQSCDVYFWTVGRDYLGVENIVTYAKDYGYGKKTGVDLPSETEGLVPTPQWKERRYNEKWSGGDTMNLSIGQGYMLATPLQVADMMAMLINDGIVYKPHFVRELRDPSSGALVRRVEPEVLIRSRISRPTFEETRSALRNVLVNGTAKVPVNTKVVLVAGKTGTAEVGLKDRWHSWFASYGPYGAKPEDTIVVVVMVEATNKWEWWAPYASNIIYQAVFAKQDYETAIRTLGLSGAVQGRGRVE
ncbi:MAG: penicillin-binding protein 2 [Rectinemataceae bacterium]|nr:penicillin-binding protein 2 [Rectinemataceae bacterium]